MKYRKLELLLMSVGIVGILISIMTSLLAGADAHEVFGQALFIPVLVFALHFGRQYGYVAAIIAAIVFLIVRTLETGSISFANTEGRLIIFQAGAFGLVGILGGEVAARIKYVVASLADDELINEQTHVFSEKYVQKQIGRLLDGYRRHGRPFALLFIDARCETLETNAPKKKQLARIANILRSNVRLVDEVGYLDDGRFCLLLPDTPAGGAVVVTRRLEKAYKGATQYLRLSTEWEASCLCLPEDESQILEFIPPSDKMSIIA